jgi:phenylpropionate dioxygenase-like ring-hydroxylating dioxygenase large terminal subunit
MDSGSRFPFTPYPEGWFVVSFSEDLRPGELRPIHVFGRQLVLFRTASGQAVVSDAFCPHLGAHLG